MKTINFALTAAFAILFQVLSFGQGHTMESLYQSMISTPIESVLKQSISPSSKKEIFRDELSARSNSLYVLDSIEYASGNIESFEYDDLNRVTSRLFSSPFGIPDETFYYYNGDSFLFDFIESNFYSFSDSLLQEKLTLKYTYNASSQVEEILFVRENFNWQTTTLTKQVYTYDDQGNLELLTRFNVDDSGTETISSETFYTYDTLGRLETVEIFNTVNEVRQLVAENKITYEDGSKKAFSVFEIISNGTVTETRNEEFRFDDLGNLVSKVYSTDPSSITIRTFYEFNFDRPKEVLIYPYASGFAPSPSSFETHNYQLLSTERTILESFSVSLTKNHWSIKETSTSTTFPKVESLTVFPNPVSDQLTIKNIDVQNDMRLNVYSTAGAQVLSINEQNFEQTIDISVLPAGAYIFTLLGTNEVLYNGKFIKQ